MRSESSARVNLQAWVNSQRRPGLLFGGRTDTARVGDTWLYPIDLPEEIFRNGFEDPNN